MAHGSGYQPLKALPSGLIRSVVQAGSQMSSIRIFICSAYGLSERLVALMDSSRLNHQNLAKRLAIACKVCKRVAVKD